MKTFAILASVAAIAFAAPALAAGNGLGNNGNGLGNGGMQLPALDVIGTIQGEALVGGGTISGSFSHGQVEINTSNGFNGSSNATMQGYGLAETNASFQLGTEEISGQLGANVASGSLSSTSLNMNGEGMANASASNLSGAGSISGVGFSATAGAGINY